jgi:internalin A
LSKPYCYFIYGTDALPYVQQLADALRARGAHAVLDIDESDDSWTRRVRLIEGASLIVYVLTRDATADALINAELHVAQTSRRTITVITFGTDVYLIPDVGKWIVERRTTPSKWLVNLISEYLTHAKPVPRKASRPRRRTTRPLDEGKLILVGRGEVGKTSLVNRLIKNKFRGDEAKTQGINITKWPLKAGTDTFHLHVWDFGGQEIMHATHQFFLTERSLYLLVLNGREGGEDVDAEYWLKHIESFGGDSPVIVVQNKVGQHPFELNYRGLQGRYPQIRGFVKTDCESGEGVRALREKIEDVIGRMPEIRMKFPADWFAVKERLESMPDEFMGYEEFRQLCAKAGVKEENDRDTLSIVLHCLGIALNYRDDARLRETSVLKPEWVTEGIYKILNAPQLAERQGELHLSDLPDILPKDRYPLTKHLFLMELMRKFSLCFPFTDESDRYLVPDLLGKEEPEETSEFPPAECLNFEYHYGVLPEGLIPRFIVRSHTLSRGQARWRSGVILAHEGCKALVHAIPAERRVIVRVKAGNASARRQLLAVIRYDFDKINAEFKDRLDAQAKVPLLKHPSFAVDYEKLIAFETKGVPKFHEYVDGAVVEVDVKALLNGVDLQEQRKLTVIDRAQAASVFVSYSHKDESLRDELETQLKILQRLGVISIWHDRRILPGTDWAAEIDMRIERAKIILLLISADFIASDYCWGIEMTRAMERHDAGEATVVPVMLRECEWDGAPFEKLHGLPKDMKAVTSFDNRDAAWKAIAAGIRKIVPASSPKA